MLTSRSEASVNGRAAPREARVALTPEAERRLSSWWGDMNLGI